MSTAPRRSFGNLAGALAILLLLLVLVLFYWVAVVFAFADSGVGSVRGLVISLAIVVLLWLCLAGLVVRWWIRGRQELWNVTLAWLVICWLTLWVVPLLAWPRFRYWLGGSLRF